MSYIPQLNLSFIHIPKTGGSSFNSELRDRKLEQFNIGHLTMSEIISGQCKFRQGDILKPINDPFERRGDVGFGGWPKDIKIAQSLILDSYKISLVRNPYNRARSAYAFLISDGTISPDLSFQEFLSDMRGYANGRPLVRSQTEFLFVEGKLAIDEVLKFEDFPQNIVNLVNTRSSVAGESFGIAQHIHNTRSKKINLNQEMKEHIYKIYRDDFENFGYSK